MGYSLIADIGTCHSVLLAYGHLSLLNGSLEAPVTDLY